MSTTMILLIGACCVGVLTVAGAVVNSPDPSEPRRPRGYRRQHGTASDVAAWTTQAPRLAARQLEEQLVSFPVGHPEQAQPVEHHGASEEWSPTAELEQVPVRPLDPERTEVRRAAGQHRRLARTVSPDRIADRRIDAAHTELDATLAPLLKRLERAGHADTDTWEWTAAEFAAIRQRAGAR